MGGGRGGWRAMEPFPVRKTIPHFYFLSASSGYLSANMESSADAAATNGRGEESCRDSGDAVADTTTNLREEQPCRDDEEGKVYEEEEEDYHFQHRNNDGMGDGVALLVMLYLLLISTLSAGAIVIGFFVVVKYGFIVLVAACAAVFAMIIVAATLMSVVTRDASLSKARTQIKRYVAVVHGFSYSSLCNIYFFTSYTCNIIIVGISQ